MNGLLGDTANRRLRLRPPSHHRNLRKGGGVPALLSERQEADTAPDDVAVSGGCWRNVNPIVASCPHRCRESAAHAGGDGDNDPSAYAFFVVSRER